MFIGLCVTLRSVTNALIGLCVTLGLVTIALIGLCVTMGPVTNALIGLCIIPSALLPICAQEMNVTMIMSIDRVEANALSEFETALRILGGKNPEQFFQDHLDAWQKVWDTGRVEVHGETNLAKVGVVSFKYNLDSTTVTVYYNDVHC